MQTANMGEIDMQCRNVLLVTLIPFLVITATDLHAAALTYGNLLISTDNVVYEYTTAGQQIQSFPVPYYGTDYQQARDIAVGQDGKVYVYNGTFDPHLSVLDPTAATWEHYTVDGWSTANNGTYGGIAAKGNDIFVTDM
ncbi:MAG: hypothetical protein ACYTF1_25515, partial [Planctomycetota bacterium]